MNNRAYEIELFLGYLKEISKQNPNEYVSKQAIYSLLTDYHVKNPKDEISYRHLFENWMENFRDVPNINCFHDQRQNRFLQFHNNDNNDAKYIKLYLSVKPEAMYESVNKVFLYAAENNMTMCSKVADIDRSDEIVLRIKEENDAINMINFINNDPYLLENYRNTNPFLNRAGIVGMGYDDLLSYNSTVSMILEDYLKNKKDSNSLDSINYNDFNNYIGDYYNKTFVTGENLNNFINKEEVIKNVSRITSYGMSDTSDCLVNYLHVIYGINNSVSCNDDFNLFMQNYNLSIDDKNNKFLKDRFNTMLNKEEIDNSYIIDDYISYACSKYGDPNVVALHLIDYARGNINAITRDNDFRSGFNNNELHQKVNEIIMNIGIENYINDIAEQTQKRSNI